MHAPKCFSAACQRLSFSLIGVTICGAVLSVACVSSGPSSSETRTTNTASTPASVAEVSGESEIGKRDGCAFLTKSEVEQVLGEVFKEPQGNIVASAAGTAAVSGCAYESVAQNRIGNSKYGLTLAIFRYPVEASTMAASTQETLKSMFSQEPQKVNGLGEAAFYGGRGEALLHQTQFYVFKGKMMLQLSVNGEKVDGEKLKSLVRIALERM